MDKINEINFAKSKGLQTEVVKKTETLEDRKARLLA
jgi:hypothetical protein